jgi:hypothetical protein
MKIIYSILSFRVMMVLTILNMVVPVSARPRNPLPPWPENALLHWQFDDPLTFKDRMFAPSVIDTSIWNEGWSGYSLNRDGVRMSPVGLPLHTTNGIPLVAPYEGTIRFWFAPQWKSSHGPGSMGRLLEMSSGTRRNDPIWWALYVTPNGDSINLACQTDRGLVDVMSVEIDWLQGQWHLIALTYSPTNTTLYLDGLAMAEGNGFPEMTDEDKEMARLIIGSDNQGRSAAKGNYDEFTTFDHQYRAWQLNMYYQALRRTAELGPIVSDEAERARIMAERVMSAVNNPKPDVLSKPMIYSLTGFSFLTPVMTASNLLLTLTGIDTNKSYDIYYTPFLQYTNSAYFATIIATGSMGQVTFSINPTNSFGFYRAAEGNDWDGDGIPNFMDAQPLNPAVSNLTVTIDMPTNLQNLQ